MSAQAGLLVEAWKEGSLPCDCCGNVMKAVWGRISRQERSIAAYCVHWTTNAPHHDAYVDLIMGDWSDDGRVDGRILVSMLCRTGGGVMVIDGCGRPPDNRELCRQAMRRDEVVGTPLAEEVFALFDAIWLQDPRIDELRERVAGDPGDDLADSPIELFVLPQKEDATHCACCGNVTRRVWGDIETRDRTVAVYFFTWTQDAPQHAANIDLIIGAWGDETTADDRALVSMLYRPGPEGGVMVIDAPDERKERSLYSQALKRDEVIGTPLAKSVFDLFDAIWEQDPRIDELRERHG